MNQSIPSATTAHAAHIAVSSRAGPAALALALLALTLSPLTLADTADAAKRVPGTRFSTGASPLVDKVRAATARYLDINVALAEGWVRATPCVSGPQSGAMGVHFVMPDRLGDGTLNASQPEALIYEPQSNGSLRLVGVEFIAIAADWAQSHPDGSPPTVDGHLTNYVSEPNRYGLPAFYELHVWAWEQNPSGSFADWNTQVTCEAQSPS